MGTLTAEERAHKVREVTQMESMARLLRICYGLGAPPGGTLTSTWVGAMLCVELHTSPLADDRPRPFDEAVFLRPDSIRRASYDGRPDVGNAPGLSEAGVNLPSPDEAITSSEAARLNATLEADMTHTAQAESANNTPITIESLAPVVHKGARVVTTETLAALYETESVRIRQNYLRNKARFIEGKHFFKVAGDELSQLKAVYLKDTQLSTAPSLTLWTERGAARHAKMLETDQAWDVFEKLEDAYFRSSESDRRSIKQPKPTTEAERLRQERLLLRERRLTLKEMRALSPDAARSLARQWGFIARTPTERPELAGLGKDGLAVHRIGGRIIVIDTEDADLRTGDDALVLRGAAIEKRRIDNSRRDETSTWAPDGYNRRVAYVGMGENHWAQVRVLGRVISVGDV